VAKRVLRGARYAARAAVRVCQRFLRQLVFCGMLMPALMRRYAEALRVPPSAASEVLIDAVPCLYHVTST